MVVMANQNYPLANGSDLTKLTDSRYFMQQRPPPHHGHPTAGSQQMPLHHKAVRDLRKQVSFPIYFCFGAIYYNLDHKAFIKNVNVRNSSREKRE